jgi:hypothetical protein
MKLLFIITIIIYFKEEIILIKDYYLLLNDFCNVIFIRLLEIMAMQVNLLNLE